MNPLLSNDKGEGQQAGFPSRKGFLEKLLMNETSNDYLRSFNLQRYLGAMNLEERQKSGHKLKNMLIECRFMKEVCNYKNFTVIFITSCKT